MYEMFRENVEFANDQFDNSANIVQNKTLANYSVPTQSKHKT